MPTVVGTPAVTDNTAEVTSQTANLPTDAGTVGIRRAVIILNGAPVSASTVNCNWTLPAGWTEVARVKSTASAWVEHTMYYQDFADGAAFPASVTATNTATASPISTVGFAIKDFGTWSVPTTQLDGTSGTDHPLTALSAAADSMLLVTVGFHSGSTVVNAFPAGYTQVAYATTGKDTQVIQKTGAGAAGSWTTSSNTRGAWIGIEIPVPATTAVQKIKYGASTVTGLRLGSTVVSKAYLGSTVVHQV